MSLFQIPGMGRSFGNTVLGFRKSITNDQWQSVQPQFGEELSNILLYMGLAAKYILACQCPLNT